MAASESIAAIQLVYTGRVQGIGLRPAIARFANMLQLGGHVANTTQGIVVWIEGPFEQVNRFTAELPQQLPRTASLKIVSQVGTQPTGVKSFCILEQPDRGPVAADIPSDLTCCPDCVAESHSRDDRRRGYPFTTCTACGPRYSILDSLPYERASTSMREFPLCRECAREFRSPSDRRFHSVTNYCPCCGPRCCCVDSALRRVADSESAVNTAAEWLRRGSIVAIRGIGGYQLAVDATSTEAVAALRARKLRPAKPLAIMVATLDAARQLAFLSDREQQALTSPAGPIVLAARRAGATIAPNVAPELDSLGIMLPTSPLHSLLLRACQRPLVVTSGNRDGEPLEYQPIAAGNPLLSIADLVLDHDRPIRHPIDDSVVRVIADRVVVLRAARGFTPMPLELPATDLIVAVGGHQKAAIALSNGSQAVLGPHVGDLETVPAWIRWQAQLSAQLRLYDFSPAAFACDLHPDYASTRWTQNQQQPSVAVQHHHAHIVSGMLEQGWLDREVLGVAFDGTGWGTDGTIWGGELLLATARGFRRVGHLLPIELPGGERAIREPWRIAAAVVARAGGKPWAASLPFRSGRVVDLLPLLDKPQFAPATTSAGRLFDAVSALALGWETAQYEGQGPMMLESICDRSAAGFYRFELSSRLPIVLDWRPAILELLEDRRQAVPPGIIAMRFHVGMARAVCELIESFPVLPVVLNGGCFQNKLLAELLVTMLNDTGRPVATPGRIPVNDGGLSAGQLAIASAIRARR